MNRILRMQKTLGVVFVALLVAGVYGTYAIFTKKFADYDRVTLQTSSIGLQLPKRGDVKIRGVIVGEVLDFDSVAPGQAEVTLGLYPDQVDTIPANVTASILPKTLFGEKFVSLDIPAAPSSDHIEAGDVIAKSRVSTEVEQVLSDLLPLLRAVRPADLNMTLSALATALEGRGDQLGENLETLDAYLKRFNPRLPELVEDLRLTSQVSDIYADVVPQVAQILDDSRVTLGTVEEREEQLTRLYGSVSSFSDSLRTFLDANEENIVRSGQVSATQLRVLSRYSTEFPCLLGGIVNAGKLQAEAFRGFVLHIMLETLPRQPRPYDAGDVPRIGDNRGPDCLNLPSPPWNQENPAPRQPNFDDGVDRPTGKGTTRPPTAYLFDTGTGFVGSRAETTMYRDLLAASLETSADRSGDLGPLLFAPMARGAEVSAE